MRKPLSLFAFLLPILVALHAHADTPALSDRHIQGFIASLPELEALEEKFQGTFDREDSLREASMADDSLATPMSSSIKELQGHPAYGELERTVRRHGFKNAAEWARVGDRILLAYMAAHLADEAPDLDRQMQEALRTIDDNPNLSAEQKQQMRAVMQQSMGGLQQMNNAPPADIAAIEPHLEALTRAFGD